MKPSMIHHQSGAGLVMTAAMRSPTQTALWRVGDVGLALQPGAGEGDIGRFLDLRGVGREGGHG